MAWRFAQQADVMIIEMTVMQKSIDDYSDDAGDASTDENNNKSNNNNDDNCNGEELNLSVIFLNKAICSMTSLP